MPQYTLAFDDDDGCWLLYRDGKGEYLARGHYSDHEALREFLAVLTRETNIQPLIKLTNDGYEAVTGP